MLKLYGEAMLRIAQLEAQLDHATHQLRRSGDGRVLAAAPELTEQGLRDLAEKVDALRNLIVESNGSSPKPRNYPQPAQAGTDDGQRTDYHRQLVQIGSLADQQARALDQRDRSHSRRKRRLRKGRPRSWWETLVSRFVP